VIEPGVKERLGSVTKRECERKSKEVKKKVRGKGRWRELGGSGKGRYSDV
jgi:hypothetical protein